MKLEYSLMPHRKINSKWIKDLDIWLDTIKLLEENKGRTHLDINCSSIFFNPPFNPPLRVIKIKTKINKWELIKLKRFCTAKETINKMERQPREWEKVFANEVTGKWFLNRRSIQTTHAGQYQKKKKKSKDRQKI